MRTRDRIFANVLLESSMTAGVAEVSLEGDEAEDVAVALERLGCKVVRAAQVGKLFVTPPIPYVNLRLSPSR